MTAHTAASPAVVIGEVHTGLVQNSTAIIGADAVDLLSLRHGRRVRVTTRPMRRAFSPDVPVGVHCRLPTLSGSRPAAVGTLATRVCLTGGRLVQSSVRAALVPAARSHRLPWSHYLARLGTVEVLGRAEPGDLATGHLLYSSRSGESQAAVLDTASVTARLMDAVQADPTLDRCPPFRAPRTRLRFAVTWPAKTAAGGGRPLDAEFVVGEDLIRTLLVRMDGQEHTDGVGYDALLRLCEDVALHDWLLTTAGRLHEVSQVESDDEAVIPRLAPLVRYLLPLWMPGAGASDSLLPIWRGLERQPGFSRQWENLAAHVRDLLALAAVAPSSKKDD